MALRATRTLRASPASTYVPCSLSLPYRTLRQCRHLGRVRVRHHLGVRLGHPGRRQNRPDLHLVRQLDDHLGHRILGDPVHPVRQILGDHLGHHALEPLRRLGEERRDGILGRHYAVGEGCRLVLAGPCPVLMRMDCCLGAGRRDEAPPCPETTQMDCCLGAGYHLALAFSQRLVLRAHLRLLERLEPLVLCLRLAREQRVLLFLRRAQPWQPVEPGLLLVPLQALFLRQPPACARQPQVPLAAFSLRAGQC